MNTRLMLLVLAAGLFVSAWRSDRQSGCVAAHVSSAAVGRSAMAVLAGHGSHRRELASRANPKSKADAVKRKFEKSRLLCGHSNSVIRRPATLPKVVVTTTRMRGESVPQRQNAIRADDLWIMTGLAHSSPVDVSPDTSKDTDDADEVSDAQRTWSSPEVTQLMLQTQQNLAMLRWRWDEVSNRIRRRTAAVQRRAVQSSVLATGQLIESLQLMQQLMQQQLSRMSATQNGKQRL